MTILHEVIHDDSEEILIRKFKGVVKVEEVIESWKHLTDNNLVTLEHKGVINDICDCDLRLNHESFPKLMKYLNGDPVLKNIKLAVVCDSSKNIAFPLIAESEEKKLNVKVFTSMKSAINWIKY